MKTELRSQLENYKKDNTKSSKEALVNTLNSLTLTNIVDTSDSSMLSMVDKAKENLTASDCNKEDIVQSVNLVISNLG